MAIDAVGKIVRVTIAALYADIQLEEVNLTYLCTIAGGTDTRPALGSAVQTLFNSNLLPTMNANSNIYGNRVSTLMPRPPDVTINQVNQVNGSSGNINLATQVRPVLSLVTALSGPANRGRIYLFTPSTAFISTTGFPSAAYIAISVTLATALMTAITSGGSTWKLSIAHRQAGSPPTYTSTLVTSWAGVNKFGTQRRSGNYGKTNFAPW